MMTALRLASVAVATLVVGALLALRPWHPAPEDIPLRLAAPQRAQSALIYVAVDKGFFRDQGLRVDLAEPATGKIGVAAVIAGSADMAFAAQMPVIDAIVQGRKPWILASLSHADPEVGIVAAQAVERIGDLRGKRVAVPKGTGMDVFLRVMLGNAGLALDAVEIIDLQPDDIPAALAAGRIDAASTIAPYLAQAAAALPGSRIFRSDGSFLDYWLLIAANDLPRRAPEAIDRMLRALAMAEDYVRVHPDDFRQIWTRHLAGRMDAPTDPMFALQLDMVIVRTMTNTARIVYGPDRPPPNFAEYFYTAGLRAVRPDAVQMSP